MKADKYIILLLGLIVLLLILLIYFIFLYRKEIFIKEILYEFKRRIKKSNITFDGNGDYKNHYYLSFKVYENDFNTHIHFITDSDKYYLCYLIKKNGKHSPLYIIEPSEDIKLIVDKMIKNFYNYN